MNTHCRWSAIPFVGPVPSMAPRSACTTTHEAFIHAVRDLAVARVGDESTRAKLLGAKLVYGSGIGLGYRGVCYFGGWENGHEQNLIEVTAAGEESNTQLAGTTIHETAHALAGMAAGHDAEWKAACEVLGLTHAAAGGQAYMVEHFDPSLWQEIEKLCLPDDGKPKFQRLGWPFSATVSVKPCPMGVGTRGGKKTRGGGKMRVFDCPCGQRARVTSDEFDATCTRCNQAFAPTVAAKVPA